jgi:hypothetical protein
MTENTHFDLAAARQAVELDTTSVLADFLDGEFHSDDSIGAASWRSDGSEFFAVRWRFEGHHARPINGFGHTNIPATQNAVTVSGLTLVENRRPDQTIDGDLDTHLRGGSVVFHRFIDWLAVFGQIGVLHLGRPMPISDVQMVAPPDDMRRWPGYNDERAARP